MSSWTTTEPNSVRNNDPVGQTSRQAACVQCLHTSEDISQRVPSFAGRVCSMNATCRQVLALNEPVLSKDMPSRLNPSSGMPFHSLQATSQALQPMQTLVSVKNPMRGGGSAYPASAAGFGARSAVIAVPLVAVGEPGAAPVLREIRQQRRPGRAPPRLYVARTDLALLDEHVRVE